MIYDCIIIGGGIAGLQAAIQLGRYERQVLVIDAAGGRSSLSRDYHNVLGWPDGISGEYLRETGRKQAESYGVKFTLGHAKSIKKKNDYFEVNLNNKQSVFSARRLLFATGITDNLPNITGIKACLGKSIYICPDCDGFEIRNKKTLIIGSGEKTISLANTLQYWSKELIIINHDKKPISPEKLAEIKTRHIPIFNHAVQQLHIENESQLTGVTLEDGQHIEANHAFLALEGSRVNSDLAHELGAERLENEHIVVNPRTKETTVQHVWAVGDVTIHSQLLTIAMGDGAQAAIWIQKSLL